MPFRILCVLLAGAAAVLAWQGSYIPIVRSIQYKFVPTSSDPPPAIDIETITEALKNRKIGLAVEERLNPNELQQAADVVRSLYSKAGRKVRVEHSVGSIPSRALEVKFDIIELCGCK